jgi:tartrate-resistant acid phosphatase type 5
MKTIPTQSLAPMTRREAIQKTLLFSTGLLTAGRLSALHAEPPLTGFSDSGLHFLAIGDFGSGKVHQVAVAQQMAEFSRQLKHPLSGVLMLGDNFYGKLAPDRFLRHFEDMYPKAELNCPFYGCLGNHDYGPSYDSGQGRDKAQMQLDYAREHPDSRWKMPAKWYAVELPNPQAPLVKLIFLDSNGFEGALTPQEKLDQKRFLEAELKKETRAPWRWIVSHFPLFSDGIKHDTHRLIQEWGGHLKAQNIPLYLCGHDHNLQHLEVEGYPSSFVVSGGGGAGLYNIQPSSRGFSDKIWGFVHLHATPEQMQVQFISAEGARLHAFSRNLAGKVTLLS